MCNSMGNRANKLEPWSAAGPRRSPTPFLEARTCWMRSRMDRILSPYNKRLKSRSQGLQSVGDTLWVSGCGVVSRRLFFCLLPRLCDVSKLTPLTHYHHADLRPQRNLLKLVRILRDEYPKLFQTTYDLIPDNKEMEARSTWLRSWAVPDHAMSCCATRQDCRLTVQRD